MTYFLSMTGNKTLADVAKVGNRVITPAGRIGTVRSTSTTTLYGMAALTVRTSAGTFTSYKIHPVTATH